MLSIFHDIDQKNLKLVARAAYQYGFPLVETMTEMEKHASHGVPTPHCAKGWNVISHMNRLYDASDHFCSVNNDTIYSQAVIDSSGGPLQLHTPEFSDKRYFSAQFIDAWSNIFGYVGTRSTGHNAQTCYIVPPGYTGDTPEHMQRIEMPTTVGCIVFRYYIKNPADYENVAKYQKETVLTQAHSKPCTGVPQIAPNTPEDYLFFEKMRLYLQAFRAHLCDFEQIEMQLEVLGQLDDKPVYTQKQEILVVLRDAFIDGPSTLEECLTELHAGKTQMEVALTAFNYNAYYFGIGVRQDAKYIISDRSVALVTRATTAYSQLWGNYPYESVYPSIYTDADGDALDGSKHRYVMTVPPQPVDGFWSVTMYSLPKFQLVDNPMHRYSVGDRTDGISINEDQSVTIYMDHTEPTDTQYKANWLPTPKGPFRPLLRAYLPHETMLQADYPIPEITKDETSN